MASSTVVDSTTPQVKDKENKKMITLVSSDGHKFNVEKAVALKSQTLKSCLEEDENATHIPLPNLESQVLVKVIEYLKMHVNANVEKPDLDDHDKKHGKTEQAKALKKYDADFVDVGEDYNALFQIILAANYLNVKALLNLSCQAVADTIKDKKPEDIRKIVNINNDFTPEEEEKIRKEHDWAYE